MHIGPLFTIAIQLLSLSTELPNILAIAGGDTVRIFHLVSTPQQQQQQAVKQEEQSTGNL